MKDGLFVIESDRHFPYESLEYSSIVYKLVKFLKPSGYVNLGDLLDAPQATEHLKDPRKMNRIEEDIGKVNTHLNTLEEEMPRGTVIHLLEGNHEDRIRRYMLQRAKNLVGIIPDFRSMYGLKDRDGKCKWTWHPIDVWDSLKIGNTVIHHGHFYNKHVAVQNLDRYCVKGVNFIQGHTHRFQYATNGSFFSASLGHGAIDRKIAHMPTPNDHELAGAVLEVSKGKGWLHPFIIRDGETRIFGKSIKA